MSEPGLQALGAERLAAVDRVGFPIQTVIYPKNVFEIAEGHPVGHRGGGKQRLTRRHGKQDMVNRSTETDRSDPCGIDDSCFRQLLYRGLEACNLIGTFLRRGEISRVPAHLQYGYSLRSQRPGGKG